MRFNQVLVLAPHPDDELGCAGLIYKLIRQKKSIQYLAFSQCNESLSEDLQGALVNEMNESMSCLEIKKYDCLDYPVRRFNEHRQEILEVLFALQKDINFDLVLVPSSFDIHQDHQVIHHETIRAFKHSTILGYELPQNLIGNHNLTTYAILDDMEVNTKMAAISKYVSQQDRPYCSGDVVASLLKVRGVQCGVKWAEAYETIRMIF